MIYFVSTESHKLAGKKESFFDDVVAGIQQR